MSLTVGTDTFISLSDAETYMAGRLGSGKVWNGTSVDDDTKTAALKTAFKTLKGCGRFSFPTGTDEISQAMKDGQCEMALFLLQHQDDMDSRLGLQAQGVRQAGIVQETYAADAGVRFPVPPLVLSLLSDYQSGGNDLAAVDIDRDDDGAANE